MYAESTGVVQRYSTSTVPVAQRLTFWNDVAARTYGPLVVDSPHGSHFDGEMACLPLGACELTSASSIAATVRYQRRSQGPGHHANALHLEFQVSGYSENSHEGRITRLVPGDFALFNPAKPYAVTFDTPTHVYVLRLPHAQLIQRGLDLEPYVGQRVPGDRGAGRMLSACMASLWPRLDAPFVDDWQEPVTDVLFTLLELIYRPSAQAAESKRAAQSSYERARRLIEEGLCDPAFDVLSVAPALGVSARYVQILFARAGTTPSRYLLRRRLELAAARLTREARNARISDIAFSVGFNDLSYFCRAFRKQYGTTPRAYRSPGS